MHLFKRKNTVVEQSRNRSLPRDRLTTEGRNRTFSYYANRSVVESNTGRELSTANKRGVSRRSSGVIFLRRALFIVIILLILAFGGSELDLSSEPRVVALSDSTGQVFLHPISTYQQAVAAIFQGSLTNRNKLTINANAISNKLRSEFPELTAVSVTLPILGHQPIVYIQPSEPSMVLETLNSGSFVLDSSGEALLSATGHSAQLAKVALLMVEDQSGLRITVGQAVLPSTIVGFIQTVSAQLRAHNIGIKSMVLPQTEASELDVYIAGEPFYVKFNTEDTTSVLQQVGTFIAVFKQLKSQGVTPQQYIDVRVTGRAYYK